MDDSDFDKALIAAAFSLAERTGWPRLSVVSAAHEAGLPLARARARFPNRLAIVTRFGVLADQAALSDVVDRGPVRDRLFDMIMRRIDVLQAHRDGVLALLNYLPTDPPLSLLVALGTRRSMRWLLEAAGVGATGLRGELRARALLGVWLWTVRAWRSDDSADLTVTMAALDDALRRAEQVAEWFGEKDQARVDDAAEQADLPPPEDTAAEEPA